MNPTSCIDSFVDELVKIASRKSEKDNRKLYGGLAAGGLAPTVANRGFGHAFMATNKPDIGGTEGDASKVLAKFRDIKHSMGLGKTNVDLNVDPHAPRGSEAMIVGKHTLPGITFKEQAEPAGFTVRTPAGTKESLLAHELGHVANHSRWGKGFTGVGSLSRVLSTGGLRVGTRVVPFVPTTASAMAATDKNTSWKPGIINAAAAAPMLFDEGAASTRAVRHLVKAHGLTGGLAKSAPLLAGFGTYAAYGLTPLAITGGRKLWHRHQAKLQAKKRA